MPISRGQMPRQLYGLGSFVKSIGKGIKKAVKGVTKAVASNTTVELLTQPLIFEESEALKVQAAQANELHVVASILEVKPRQVVT